MPERLNFTLINKNTKGAISREAKIAGTFSQRLLGLMFRKGMKREEALVFYRAASIHTFFMRFPIDLVYLDKQNKVVKIYDALKPWKLAFCVKAFAVIELPAHKASQKSLKIGDVLELVPFKE